MNYYLALVNLHLSVNIFDEENNVQIYYMFVLVRDSSENVVKAGISSTDEYDSKENQQNIEIYTVSGRVVQKK